MKNLLKLSLFSAALIVLSGCGGGGETPKKETKTPKASGIPAKDFDVVACSNPDDSGCLDAKTFDLKKQNVAILNPPKNIGVGEFVYYKGKRFGLVPKDENELSPLNFIAYGLYKYAQELGSNWCGPCRMNAPVSYSDAKNKLKELFNLTGTKEQNEALLWLMNQNLEKLAKESLPLKEAYFADIKALAESLVNLTKNSTAPDLSALHLVKDNKGKVLGVSSTPKKDCPSYLGGCLESWGVLDKEQVLKIAKQYRKESDTLSASDKAFENLVCKDSENKQIFMYGVEDNFNLINSEPTNPQGQLLTYISSWPNHSGYDNNTSMPTFDANGNIISYNLLFFAETLSNLPTNMTKAYIAMGIKRFEKSSANNTQLWIGNAASNDGSLVDAVNPTNSAWIHVPNSKTYYKDLAQHNLPNASISALEHIQNGNGYLDVVGFGYFDIDYIAVAACVPKPKPRGIPVAEVPIKFECNQDKGEHLITIWGGSGDDFALPIDATNPIINNSIKYDENIEKSAIFSDRIALPNQTFTKLAILTNTKASAPGYQNDQLFIGAYDSTNPKGLIFNANTNVYMPTLNGGLSHISYGTDSILNSSNQNVGVLLDLANSNHYIDVIAYDQTKVDTVKILACAVDKKDGDLNITKKAGRVFTKGGENYSNFNIEVGGTLPNGETLVINENVPAGVHLDILNAPLPWSCSPSTPPIIGQATVTCTISANNGDINNIPPINLTMGTKFKQIENCANINKESQETFYNNNPKNDKDCATVVFNPPKEGDLEITKKVIKSSTTRDGVNHAIYKISISGTLPANEPLSIDEIVPNGAELVNISVSNPWSCSPSTPISGLATVTCSIPAQSSALNPIPDIIIEMKTKEDKLENCANINKEFSPVYYNTDTKNDKSCDSATFGSGEGDVCSEQIVVALGNPNLWRDSNGNHPNVNNPIPNTWDNSYTWFNFPQTAYAYYTLKSKKFCACGLGGGVKLQGMRIDNVGNLKLNSLSTNTSTLIAAQNTATTHNFLAAYPPAVGSALIPSNIIGKNYELEFNIHNHKIWAGGALKGELKFTGHWGECTKDDVVRVKPMKPLSVKPIVYSDFNPSSSFDENSTVAVIEYEKDINLPNESSKVPDVILVKDLQASSKTPEDIFGNKLPDNYTLIVGCAFKKVYIVINGSEIPAFESNKECNSDWIKYNQ